MSTVCRLNDPAALRGVPKWDELVARAARLGTSLASRGLRVVTAESCTGGLLAAVMTENPGSSEWFDRGFVTYSNSAKMDQLGVIPDTIERYGAVSEPVVRQMAVGALAASQAQLALAISGVAGPGGGSPDKPVGTVCLGWAIRFAHRHRPQVAMPQVGAASVRLPGDRHAVRLLSVRLALVLAEDCCLGRG